MDFSPKPNHMSKKTQLNISSLVIFTIALSLPIIGKGQSKRLDKAYKSTIHKKYSIDPSIPLTARIIETSNEILQKFRDAGMSPTVHQISKADSLKVVSAFKSLPPLHQQILKDHLVGISFLDNMPNTALTATVNPEDRFPVFTITFRAEILKQDVSQWLTEKESSYFTKNPNLRIAIDAGKMDAIYYVLLHEATHVVDGALGIINDEKQMSGIGSDFKGFTNNIWKDRTHLFPNFMDTLSDQARFRNGGKLLPIEYAKDIYLSAAKKPFVSLYSTASWHEDLAEYLSVTHLTRKLKQPFRILIYEGDKEIFSYEPMTSSMVNSRTDFMKYFYRRKVGT